jgi:acyl-CoA thioester hydrolase
MIFRHPIRVYWEDTDAGGIVYHSNYLNFAERARTEMVESLGINQRALADDGKGFAFAVRRAEMDFLKPARLLDRLEVESRVIEAGGASLSMVQTIRRLDECADLVRLHIHLAFISLDGRPARLPAEMRATLRALVSER